MRVKFLQSVAAESWCYLPGETHDLPPDIARQYIAQGIAEIAPDERQDEHAAILGQDRAAVKPRPRAYRSPGEP